MRRPPGARCAMPVRNRGKRKEESCRQHNNSNTITAWPLLTCLPGRTAEVQTARLNLFRAHVFQSTGRTRIAETWQDERNNTDQGNSVSSHVLSIRCAKCVLVTPSAHELTRVRTEDCWKSEKWRPVNTVVGHRGQSSRGCLSTHPLKR